MADSLPKENNALATTHYNMMKRVWRMIPRSISGRVFFALSLTTLAITILFWTIYQPLENNRRKAHLEQVELLLQVTATQQNETIANEIFGNKLRALEKTTQSILAIPDVVEAAVYDAQGRLLCAYPGPATESLQELPQLADGAHFTVTDNSHPRRAVYITPVVMLGELFGFQKISYDLGRLEEETSWSSTLFLGLTVSLLLVSSALLQVLLSRSVIRPVERLRHALSLVQQGRYGIQVKLKSHNEISEMAEAFNAMSRELKDAIESKDHYAAELNEMFDRVDRKAQQLERANKRLRELDKMKSAFLSSVSHELRTPLTSVRGFAKLIARDMAFVLSPVTRDTARAKDRAERVGRNLDIILTESERLTNMINDVLDLSRIEEGRMNWRDEPVPIVDIMNKASSSVEGLFMHNDKIHLSVDMESPSTLILIDPERIHQVLINLLSNAVKFTDTGTIHLNSGKDKDGNILFSVKDPGVGVSDKEVPLIFNKFHQSLGSGPQDGKPKGTGLGLAISKNIVSHYKGRIWVESTPGEGSVFLVRLPSALKISAVNSPQ